MMQKERSTQKNPQSSSSYWPKAMMDFYAQGLDTARVQIKRNCKVLEEVGATMSSNGENVARTAGAATEGYMKLAASAAELCWRSIASGQEASRAVMGSPVRELSQVEENTAQSLLENVSAQMTWLNAAMAKTASGMMESFRISGPEADRQSSAVVAPEQVH